MAETLLSKLVEAVLSQAVETIAELLKNDAISLISVRGDVKGLQAELRRMKCFLEDANRKQEKDSRVRNWIAEVGDVADDVEDVIETFIWKVSSSYAVFKVFHLHKLRNEINIIQAKLNGIFKSTQLYNIGFSSGEESSSMADQLLRNLRRSYPDDEDEDIIILEDTTAALKGELMKVEDRLCVASVVGMGGLGKTTLAKKVYNHVKHHFDRYAWVFVSQQYVPREILSEILMQIGFDHTQNYERKSIEEKTNKREILRKLEDHDLVIEKTNKREILRKLEDHDLVELLKNELKEKRYLVVLDDIWRIEAWDSIKNAFPKGNRGSKVLFTTRNKEVALFADPRSSPIEPSLLTSEESWELFRQKALLRSTSNEYDSRPEFEVLGREMLKKCEGLPLAIIILGGLLRTRDSTDGWKEVKKNLTAHLNKLKSHQEYEGVDGILSLSYYDLPYYLKPCFLYLGTFPEDREIPKRTLFQLWIAEGFVHPSSHHGETAEDLAEQYIGELANRCLVQVSKRRESGIGVKAYRMHDLMRDMCLSKAKELNFFEIIQEREMNRMIQSRRIAIHHPCCDFSRYQVQTRLRSLVCFEINDFSPSCLRSKSFVTLRALELGFSSRLRVDFSMLEAICQLIHLRHLGLRDTGITKLPNTISNLQNLYTLDLRDNIVILPGGISRLTRLTHLLAFFTFDMDRWRVQKGDYFNIVRRVKKYISFARVDILDKLTNLHNLKIISSSLEDVRALLECPIFKTSSLQSLVMSLEFYQEFPNLQPLSHCHHLSKLELVGKIPEANLQYLPPSLVKLSLFYSNIHQDPMPILEKLTNLRFLSLSTNCYCGSEMVCSADGFPKLETLLLTFFPSLEEWQIQKGAMPSLKRLQIAKLRNLKMIPEGLKFITTLRQLDVRFMPPTFADRLRAGENGIEGEDYYKVRHILSITLFSNIF